VFRVSRDFSAMRPLYPLNPTILSNLHHRTVLHLDLEISGDKRISAFIISARFVSATD